MSLNFAQLSLQTVELAVLGCLELPKTYNERNVVATLALLFFVLIFFILVGNKDMHKSLAEFDFRSESTTDHGVSSH